jgi:drug/metabolite transporter (DMT)-like permease
MQVNQNNLDTGIRRSDSVCHLFALGTIFLWSSAYPLTRFALQHFPPSALSVLRYLTASLVLLVWALLRREKRPARKDIPLFFLSGLLGFSAYVMLFNLGSQTLPAAVSSVLLTTVTIFTALFALLLWRERIPPLGWVAAAVEFCGVLILCLWDGGIVLSSGIFWILAASLSLSGYNLTQRLLTRRYTPFQATAYSIFSGTLLLLPLLPRALPSLLTAPALQVGTVLFLGFFPSAAAYVFWSNALKRAARTGDVTIICF